MMYNILNFSIMFIVELTFLEESLLKQAQEESLRKEREHSEEESEVERLAELRRKGRGKGHKNYHFDFKIKIFFLSVTLSRSFCWNSLVLPCRFFFFLLIFHTYF